MQNGSLIKSTRGMERKSGSFGLAIEAVGRPSPLLSGRRSGMQSAMNATVSESCGNREAVSDYCNHVQGNAAPG
jgi:hypothetical protein